YVRNYGTAVSCLNQLQDYKPYLRYHEECMLQKRTNRQSLKDLLMLPIQRITRYTLLLKNILKHTPAVHGDHIELCRAVKNVTHFASIVNECRRKQEEMHRLIEIFRTIELCPPLPHSDSRSFVTEFIVREL
ncbi:Dbl homology domain-containing protein, partial [Martensiomyces pterosporus]